MADDKITLHMHLLESFMQKASTPEQIAAANEIKELRAKVLKLEQELKALQQPVVPKQSRSKKK